MSGGLDEFQLSGGDSQHAAEQKPVAPALDVGGAEREVSVLRVGRTGLYYQSIDGQFSGVWDKDAKGWLELTDGASRNQIRQGLKIANKQVAPELMMLPINAPESAR